jgi:polyphenol oxidase
MRSPADARMHPDWLTPQWPAPARVRAVCTTRAGGQSRAPFDALNLGDHVGDLAADVVANRARLQQVIGAQPVFLSQVHGSEVVQISAAIQDGTSADGCLTDQRGLACTIMVADCLPVLLTNRSGTCVAAAHAGWRGLAGQAGQGILEETVERFRALAHVNHGDDATEIIAWLGPCIGPDAFEVGDEVRDAFGAGSGTASALFKPVLASDGPGPGGKWLGDLQGLARLRLAAMGVQGIYGNDGSRDWCTVSNPLRFFSHRRDRVSGRLAACVWLD